MLTYSQIIAYCQGGAGTTDSVIKTFLKQRIQDRYRLITNKLNTWTQEVTLTLTSGDSLGASQQFYYNPPNLREITAIKVTIGGQDYNLRPVDSQEEWNRLNAAPSADGGFPERYFRRANDYGIWPYSFEDDGTIEITYTRRAVPLYFEDYTTGTAAVTENSQAVNLTTGVTTTLKAGFYFSLADSIGEPRGTFYRIGSITDSDTVALETYFEEVTESGSKYIVGQVPEIPEEGHELIALGALADFYLLKEKDFDSAKQLENKFWTGSTNVTPAMAKKDGDYGGLLALIDAYKDRDSSMILDRSGDSSHPLEFRTPRVGTLT